MSLQRRNDARLRPGSSSGKCDDLVTLPVVRRRAAVAGVRGSVAMDARQVVDVPALAQRLMCGRSFGVAGNGFGLDAANALVAD
jgi:hypothetical protein